MLYVYIYIYKYICMDTDPTISISRFPLSTVLGPSPTAQRCIARLVSCDDFDGWIVDLQGRLSGNSRLGPPTVTAAWWLDKPL